MDIVTIAASDELSELRLTDLIGRKGKVIEVLYKKDGTTVRGAWLELLGEPYLNEQEWYIPSKSIVK